MSAYVIDAFEFCRTNGRREGSIAVAMLARLGRDCADQSGQLDWVLEGATSAHGYPQLTMTVAGTVQLMCQRCLIPFAFEIASCTVLMLGKNDEQADEMEGIIADDAIDVIVGSRSMEINDLIEDEALLALPQAPKHDVCPDVLATDGVLGGKMSPFADLKSLATE